MAEEKKKGVGMGVGAVGNNESKLGYVKAKPNTELVAPVPSKENYEEVPHDCPETIKNSKHVREYCAWIRADWSALKCQREAETQYGEKIGDDTFGRLKKIIKEREGIRPNYKTAILHGVEVKYFDTVQEMRNAIALRFQRIAEMYQKEKAMQDQSGFVPFVLGALQTEQDGLSKDIALLFQMEMKEKEFNLQRTVKMGVVGNEEIIDIEPSNEPSEREIQKVVAGYTPEQAKRMLEAIASIEAIYLLDIPEVFDEVKAEEAVELVIAHLLRVDDFSKVTDYYEIKYAEFPLFRARDVKVTEYVKMERV